MNNRYKVGQDRYGTGAFQPILDDNIAKDNPVRAIDAYVDALDMVEMGFTNTCLASPTGQPPYHPKLLMKIYMYGYINKVRSSRKLETEIQRNIEMIWLCQALQPCYKTIANFRKDNAKPLQDAFKKFVLLCKEWTLIGGKTAAIDGAFLRANASKNQLIMKKTLEKDIKRLDTRIDKYLKSLTTEDKNDEKLQVMIEKKRQK
jgi:transposase